MGKRIWQSLFLIAFLWAAASTYLYLRLKNNPMVVAVTTGMNSSPLAQESFQLGEMEKVTFLRQYLDRYFNYDANNFWQSQTSLSFLMAPDLRDQRIAEVRRLREKVQQKNISQKAQLLSLRSIGKDRFEAILKVQITEEQNKTSALTMTLQMGLEKTERTLENPWGLLAQRMDFTNSSSEPLSFESELKIKEKTPLIVTLPCAIENIESSDETALQVKITTLNISEIQLTTTSTLKAPVQLKAVCKDNEFAFTVAAAKEDQNLFKAFPLSAGIIRKKEVPAANQPANSRKKDIYEKTIENVLGIKVDN